MRESDPAPTTYLISLFETWNAFCSRQVIAIGKSLQTSDPQSKVGRDPQLRKKPCTKASAMVLKGLEHRINLRNQQARPTAFPESLDDISHPTFASADSSRETPERIRVRSFPASTNP
ncbi:hypothetical protein AVEN_144895-1 [Araneus ventricosus]|uniref:Uncharacterized protein n=1 Tax=Araneus ventricosus TaxID=182803 RepID=A0A4Y2TER0_ARAVE|nr:hypothetical protein AVEN_144895-1 [Araneus ventricosus]